MEEQVIQETPVATPEQPVAETTTSTPAVDAFAYEQQIQALKDQIVFLQMGLDEKI